jgi:hypothetical protein
MTEAPARSLVILGAFLGALVGAIFAIRGGVIVDQIGLLCIFGLVLIEYLTLAGSALSAGRSVPQAIIAAACSAPVVILLGTLVGLGATALLFAVAFAVPVTLVFSAIYFLPPLSFMLTWPGEVIAAVTMPFVILWIMLLEIFLPDEPTNGSSTGLARPELGRLRRVTHVLRRTVSPATTLSRRIVGRLRSAGVDRWLVVPGRPLPFAAAFVAGAFLLFPVLVLAGLLVRYEYNGTYEDSGVGVVLGVAISSLYGAGAGVVAYIVSGLDDS